MALATGTRLGSYEIVGALGAGGMGEVYRARDTKLNRDVALKVLPELFALDPDRLARFKREAQVLASLNHPNIAAIYGFEEWDAVQALILELVDGSTLAERLARPEGRALPASSSGGASGSGRRSLDRPDRASAMPLTEALTIARQIAEALEAAHEQGIIHRDLKPANIKLRADGTVKVLDFGLAKLVEGPAEGVHDDRSGRLQPNLTASPTITTPAMTEMGVILGTAGYMSPEQAKGRAADKRSDIWAFGCVLYEMLTGKRAFEGEDVSDTLAAVLRGEPDWTALPADAPPLILKLVHRCLEKDRRERVGDVSTALFLIKEVREMPATPTQPTVRSLPLWRRAVPVLATAIVALALGGGVVWRFKPSTPLTVTRFSFALGEGQQFFNAGRHLLGISPDGTQMVYVANRQLYLRSISELEARPIPVTQVPQGMTTPVFSPDGRSIAFVTVGILERVGVSGGTPVTISDLGGAVYGMSWADDAILLGLGGGGIARVSANGGTLERIVAVKADELAHGPQMLPGDRAVLFTLATGTGDDRWDRAKIVVQTLASGERKTLINGGADARYLPTGHVVYARGGILFAIPFDPERLAVAGGPVRIAEGVARAQTSSNNTGAAHFSVSITGSLIYLTGPSTASFPRDLAVMDRKGLVQNLKLPPRPYESPRFSPDGKRVAVGTDDGKEAIVWIHDLAGASSARRLTLEGRNRFPIWSADGQRVAFQSDREGDLGIFWQHADGSGTPERLTKPEQGESHVPISWSPDGQKFLFSLIKGTNFSLWTFSFSDRKAAPFGAVQSAVLPNAVFSPDGRWVAYESSERTEGRGRAVFVQPFPSTGEKHQIAAGGLPFWSRDGNHLFFAESISGTELSVVSITTRPNLAFGNPTRVPRVGTMATRGGTNSPRNWDIAADDNRQIGVVDPEETQPQIRVVLNWFEELKARVPTK